MIKTMTDVYQLLSKFLRQQHELFLPPHSFFLLIDLFTRLATLCQELGSPLDYNALESAVLVLDTDGDGQIQYNEFVNWYKGSM
jgi:hypothetical protein